MRGVARPVSANPDERWCTSGEGHFTARAAFNKDRHRPDGLSDHCKACNRERKRAQYVRERPSRLTYAKQHREDNREQRLTEGKLVRMQLRLRVIAAYGGACECCGESRWEFLALDHTHGGGNAHRRKVGAVGSAFYRWVEKEGFPKDILRLLCDNCNMARGRYGYCPHEKEVA